MKKQIKAWAVVDPIDAALDGYYAQEIGGFIRAIFTSRHLARKFTWKVGDVSVCKVVPCTISYSLASKRGGKKTSKK